MEKKRIKIGTRGSELALWQAGHIKELLQSEFPGITFEIITFSTRGDSDRHLQGASAEQRGMFTSSLEDALIRSDIDIAVHSLKDLPVEMPEGLRLAAVPERENPADVLVAKDGLKLIELPPGGRVLTGSPRRRALVLDQRPDLHVEGVRGNVPTRIEKLHASDADALVLAYAGLKRLGLQDHTTEILSVNTFIPAPGQGALAVQTRADCSFVNNLCAAVDHGPSRLCVTAERAFFHAIGAGCHAEAGAVATMDGSTITLQGFFSDSDQRLVRKELVQEVNDELEAQAAGYHLAEKFQRKKTQMNDHTPGKVFLVGAGPGDPRLLTLRGREVLEGADVVVYDRLISPQLLGLAGPHAEMIYAGKSPGAHTLSQDQINSLLVQHAKEGNQVVRLKGGDPFIFGRGGEEVEALAEANVEFEIVPGITAAAGACAYAGIPLTHRGKSGAVAFITGHDSAESDGGPDWEALARFRGTLVFYMGVSRMDDICRKLLQSGKTESTPAAVVENGTRAGQRTLRAKLGNIVEKARQQGVSPPALLIIGEVAAMDKSLDWYGHLPLFSKKIVITRPAGRAAEMASDVLEAGGEPVLAPAIKIQPPADSQPLMDELTVLQEYDLVIFTSVAGVDSFFGHLFQSGKDARSLSDVSICAIGPKTSAGLRQYGITHDLMPERYISESLVEMLDERQMLDGKKVLCPRSDIAPPNLVEMLQSRGATVKEVHAYSVRPDNSGIEKVREMIDDENNDGIWLTFTSASTVKSFFEMIEPSRIRPGISVASIGPHTSAALENMGVPIDVEAKKHTAEGMISAIICFE